MGAHDTPLDDLDVEDGQDVKGGTLEPELMKDVRHAARVASEKVEEKVDKFMPPTGP